MNIQSILNSNVIFATENSTALDVAKIMETESVGSVVIVDKNKNSIPVGIVTDRDIVLKAVTKNINLEQIKAPEVMTKDILTVKESDDIESVVNLMCERRVRRTPVVNNDGALVGIISLDDIIKNESQLLSKIGLLIGRQV